MAFPYLPMGLNGPNCWLALLARITSTSIGEVRLHQRTCRSYNCESAQVQLQVEVFPLLR